MPRTAEGALKFQSPLYCAGWAGPYCLVAGGGGKKSSGIPNRLWCVEQAGGRLGETAATLDLGEDAPLRLALPPDRRCALLAVGTGGLVRVDLDTAARPPVLSRHTGEAAARLKALGQVKCLAFSRDGRLLGLGLEDGELRVLDWPSLTARRHLRGAAVKAALRDLDFSAAHGYKVLGAAYEDGSCLLWEWASATQLAALRLPPELARGGGFARVRFAPGAGARFLTVVNAGGRGHLLAWAQDAAGEVALQARVCAHAAAAVTAFDVSPCGRRLGTGTSEGELAVFPASLAGPPVRVPRAHMVFATAAAFAPNGDCLLSVSADASARCLAIAGGSRRSRGALLAPLLVALLALLLGFVLRTQSWPAVSDMLRSRSLIGA